ncbi:MAG: hypothetical protein HYU51_14255 [Candidatus Rokubacteria bacterium]|nr:hypothetical protein [Candidatus Rokubacteria bacterium]
MTRHAIEHDLDVLEAQARRYERLVVGVIVGAAVLAVVLAWLPLGRWFPRAGRAADTARGAARKTGRAARTGVQVAGTGAQAVKTGADVARALRALRRT